MNKAAKERYARMQLKSGWDLPEGEKPPLTGRKRELARAYELLVLKPDEELSGHILQADNDLPAKRSERSDHAGSASALTKAEEWTRQTEQLQEQVTRDDHADSLETISAFDLKKKRRRRLLIGLASALIIILAVGGRILFGPAILLADISGYRETTVEIEGLKDEPFEVSIDEIAKLKKTSLHMDVHQGELSADEEPLSGDAIGPTLETFLRKYGKSVDDFRSMRVYAGNDQSKAYVRTMKEEEIILSVADGRQALAEKQAPLRIATSAEDPSEWRGWVRKIVFTK